MQINFFEKYNKQPLRDMELSYQLMISGFLYQFYLPVRHHTIRKEHKKYEGKYKEHIDENQNEFLN